VYVGGGYVDGSLEYYGLFMPMVFLFAGLISGGRTCLVLGLAGLVGTGVAVAGAQEASSLAALLLMLVLAVIIGGVLARIQTAQRRTVQAMQGVLDAAARLGAATTELAVGAVVADITGELLHADHVTVLNDGRGDAEVRRIGWYTSPVRPGPTSIGLRRASRLVLPIPGSAGRGDRGSIVVVWSSARTGAHPVGKHMAGLLAAEAGRVLERLAATARLAAEATTDPLTGLDNRRVFADRLAVLEPGDAIVLCDLDHFKRVNDTLGHVRGDEVLRVFATCLEQTARSSDTVTRYGGEEFALILPDVDSAGAGELVERLRSAWASSDPVTTFSAGLALHVPGAEPGDTFRAADEALYAAKDGGRDRWVVAAGPPPDDPPPDHLRDLQASVSEA
jgi:diguanylate cyclase (GGDEF)-like protein